MHAGLTMIWSLFSAGGSSSKEEDKKSKRLSQLSPNDQALYQKIVNDLITYHTQINVSTNYAIVFRESESWIKVDKLFKRVQHESAIRDDFDTKVWVQEWQQRITDLRGQQKSIQDDIIEKNKTTDSKKIASCNTTIAFAKARISEIIEDAEKAIKNDFSNKKFTNDLHCRITLNFLYENWLHLTVFSEWSDVSMDERKLYVQIRQPRDPNEKDMNKYLNLSTKAIFILESADLSKPFKLKRQCIGPRTPVQLRRTSSVKVTTEVFLDYAYMDDPSAKQVEAKTSSMGDKLHQIVNLALSDLNSQIANMDERAYNAPQIDGDGHRFDLSLRISRRNLD